MAKWVKSRDLTPAEKTILALRQREQFWFIGLVISIFVSVSLALVLFRLTN